MGGTEVERDIIIVLGEFDGACFVIVQQIPLVFFRYLAPILVYTCSAWARRARS